MFKINAIRNKIDRVFGFEASNINQIDEKYHKKRTDLFIFIGKSLIFIVLNIEKKDSKKVYSSGSFPDMGYTRKFIKFSQQKNLIFHDR